MTIQTMQEHDYIPAEWEPQECLWTAWPSHADLWLDNLRPARAEIAAMVTAIAMDEHVNILVCGTEAMPSAQESFQNIPNITIHHANFGDIWLRDTGPIFTKKGQALRFKHNGWGGKYVLAHDDTVGDDVVNLSDAPPVYNDFILEGGAVEHNGAGVILTTRQCVLNPNRNAGWDEAIATDALKKAFSAHRICWLDDGLLNDHTDGHIDNIARFIGENHVVCQHASGEDDPNAATYKNIENTLKNMGFDVSTIPSPGRFLNEDGDIVPASHMNFIITNKTVVVPTYGTSSAEKAVCDIAALFPNHKVIGLSSSAILSGGGSFHCITQQEPARP